MRDFILFILGSLCAVMLFGWFFDGVKNTVYVYTKKNNPKGKRRR